MKNRREIKLQNGRTVRLDVPRSMTLLELEHARRFDPRTYPQDMPCLQCGYAWMQHSGELCPIRPGTMVLVDMVDHYEYRGVPPVVGTTRFVPDLDYFNLNPNFDVV